MKNTFAALTEAELERLDQFLISRFGDDPDTKGKDEGVIVVSELDGFLTAIVSGPSMIPPSHWLPAVWGDFEPEWNDERDFEEILTMMIRLMNEISITLMEAPGKFEPLFLEREKEGRTYTIVDEWCEGYLRGVSLRAEQWESGGLEMEALLAPIMTFATEHGWKILDKLSDDDIEKLQQEIIPSVRNIHAYWLARREDFAPVNVPLTRSEPQVGRNDPCPCGSGKKYKKCCLH